MKTTSRTRRRKGFVSLKEWRDAQGLSQAEAAELLEISQKSYSRFETGQRYVKGPLAARLVARTGVSLGVLVGVAS